MKGESMKGPSIAVMLGSKPKEDEDGELSMSEAKARAEDAATVFADATAAKDAPKIVKSFCSLMTLCGHLEELKDSGEDYDDEEESEKEEPEAESTEE